MNTTKEQDVVDLIVNSNHDEITITQVISSQENTAPVSENESIQQKKEKKTEKN